MSRIWGILVGVCAVVGVGAIVFHFSGARGKVAKQNIEDKIDELLGKSKVQRQELADKIEKGREAVETLFDGRVRAQVRVERLTKDIQPAKGKYEASAKKLETILTAVEKVTKDDTYEVSINDTKYSHKNVAALQTLLKDQTEMQTALKRDYDEKKKILAEAERTFNLLKNQEQDARKNLAMAEMRKKALDEKMEALEFQQKAAKLLADGKKNSAANFDEINKALSDLEDSTETQFRKAEETATVQAESMMKGSKGGEDIEETIRAAREALGSK